MATPIAVARRSLTHLNTPANLLDDAVSELILRVITSGKELTPYNIRHLAWNTHRDIYWASITPFTGVSPVTIYKDYRSGIHHLHVPLTDAIQQISPSQEDSGVEQQLDLSTLPDPLRQVIDLMYFTPAPEYTGVGRPPDNLSQWGLTASEAGRRLNLTEAAIRSRHKKALQHLRKELNAPEG